MKRLLLAALALCLASPADAQVSLYRPGTDASVAHWPTSVVRFYRLSTTGSDSGGCYIEAAAGAALSSTTNVCKTWAKILASLPRFGNGRSVVIMAKAGTYAEPVDLTGFMGYAYFAVRGSTDLTNSVSDRLTAGARTAVTGPNGDSSFTITAGATASVFTMAAGSLGSNDADVGWRARFVTGALANVSCFITQNTATVVTCGKDMSGTPANGDTVAIERPGVLVTSYVEGGPHFLQQMTGIAVTGTTAASLGLGVPAESSRYAFFETTGATTSTVVSDSAHNGSININDFWQDETGTSRITGGSRVNNGWSITRDNRLNLTSVAFVHATATVTLGGLSSSVGAGGSYFANGCTVQPTIPKSGALTFGTTSGTERYTRSLQQVTILAPAALVQHVNVTGSSTAGISLRGPGSSTSSAGFYQLTDIIGSSNTTYGVNASLLAGGGFSIMNSSITGTTAEVGLNAGAYTTLCSLDGGNNGCGTANYRVRYIDPSGNSIGHDLTNGNAPGMAGSCELVTRNDATTITPGMIVRPDGTASPRRVSLAQADTQAKAKGYLLYAVTTMNTDADKGIACKAPMWVLHSAAPAVGAMSYLDQANAGKATQTVPPVAATNQKRGLGHCAQVQGNWCWITDEPQFTPILSDAVAIP